MILLDTNICICICICIYIINAKPPAALARFQQYRMGDIGLCSVYVFRGVPSTTNAASAAMYHHNL